MWEVEIIRPGRRKLKKREGMRKLSLPGICSEQVSGDIYKDRREKTGRKRFLRDEGGGCQEFSLEHIN